MKRASVLFLIVLCFFILVSRQVTDAAGDAESAAKQRIATPIGFEDPNLEAAVRNAIGKQSGQLMDTDVMSVNYLDASNCNISRLGGIEHLTGLTDLDLYNNRISDISPLAELTSLEWLNLYCNQVSDISPLTANPGLGQGCRISLDGNRLDLSPESDDMQTINTLMRRGASVCY